MIGLVAVIALAVAGCGSASTAGGISKSTTDRTSSTPTVTGFGATNAEWNATHVADKSCAPCSNYNPDPALAKAVGDKYSAVLRTDGHVSDYIYSFVNQSFEAAKANVLRTQFPSDAKVVWFRHTPKCVQMLVKSAAIGKELRGIHFHDPTGSVLVYFFSGLDEKPYSARSVNEALLKLLLGPIPSYQAPDC